MELKVGKNVFHDTFGVGTITRIDNNTVVQINFNGEEKRLMIKYAKFKEPTSDQIENSKSKQIQTNESVNFFDSNKEQENMSDADLMELSKYFNSELPKHFANFLKNFPIKISSFKREYSVANELLTERYFRNTVESLKEVNKYFEAFELNGLIAIGDDGCGNYYAIKSEDNDTNVYFINHEGYLDKQLNKYVRLTNENFKKLVEIEAPTLNEYGEKIIKDSIEFHESK